MNLIYATAAQTTVLDACLQKFDGGRRPASLYHDGRPTFYSPADESMLDVLAQLCASNWMGRAWTLQEGVLSNMLLFPLGGSIAYFKLLWERSDKDPSKELRANIRYCWETIQRQYLGRSQLGDAVEASPSNDQDESEPFQDRIRNELLHVMKTLLNTNEYHKYARSSTERAALFTKSHSLLQSRSTTQMEDLPLILFNMSGMNGNSVAQCKDSNERMKLLFYGLKYLPIELLFSDCARVRRCEVDAWIPREIVPEKFSGTHTLRLEPCGFTFTQPEDEPLKFYLLPGSTSWENEVLLYLPGEGNTRTKYRAKTSTSSDRQPPNESKYGWCILVGGADLEKRGARFMITRMKGRTVFLHFDCPLLLCSTSTGDSEKHLKNVSIALPATDQKHFVIERSDTPEMLGMPRPQNPVQYSYRLIVVGDSLNFGVCFLQYEVLQYFLPESAIESNFLMIPWYILCCKQGMWMQDGLQSLAHHAWVETFKPSWTLSGPWGYFFGSMMVGDWMGVIWNTLYWLLIYPGDELSMYLIALVWLCLAMILWLVKRHGE